MPFPFISPARARATSARTTSVGLAALIMAAFPQSAFADVKAGVDAWGRGDYETAIKEWRKPALDGDADAQFNMGQAHKFGRGVPMDLNIAADWFRQAAEKGHLQAADNYGLILFQNGQRKDALPWLESSAARGEPRAQYIMGTAYFNGELVSKDWVRAYALMTRASSSGLPQASQNLAAMDRYLTPNQRQEGIALAGKLQQQADRERQQQLAAATLPPVASGNLPARPSASTGPLQTAALPPSRPTPRPVTKPSVTPPASTGTFSASSNAGADFSLPGTPRPAPAPVAARPAPVAATPAPRPVAATGSWRLQLGAFGSQSKAESLWSSLESRNSNLQGLQPYLVKAGKVTRLQVGNFASRSEADRLCGQLKASGQACFPIKK